MLQKDAVVAGDVGLALRGVDNHRVHLSQAGGNLDVGGEGGPAHAYDAGLPDEGGKLLGGEAVRVWGRRETPIERFVEVVFNHHAHHRHTGKMDAGLHRRHPSGNTGVNGSGDEGRSVPYLLTHHYLVPHRYTGGTGRADVQRHGNHHTGRRRKGLNRLFVGQILLIVGMYAAEKGLRHIFTSFSSQHLYLQPGMPGGGCGYRFLHLSICNTPSIPVFCLAGGQNPGSSIYI